MALAEVVTGGQLKRWMDLEASWLAFGKVVKSGRGWAEQGGEQRGADRKKTCGPSGSLIEWRANHSIGRRRHQSKAD